MKLRPILLSTAMIIAGLSVSGSANASGDPMIGEIMQTGFNFCPRGWAKTDGQLLAISSNNALFSLVGTIYGGDGRTTFALPDLRGRAPVHVGSGPGLSPRAMGSRTGLETTVMTVAQMPAHSHTAGIRTLSGQPNTNSPVGASFSNAAVNAYNNSATPTGRFMNADTVGLQATGSGTAQTNIQPVLANMYCIALVGTYPSRN